MIIEKHTLTRALRDSYSEDWEGLKTLYSAPVLHVTREKLHDRLQTAIAQRNWLVADNTEDSIRQVEIALQKLGWNFTKPHSITIRNAGHTIPQPIGFYL